MKFLPTHNVLVTSSWDKSVIWVQNFFMMFIKNFPNVFIMLSWFLNNYGICAVYYYFSLLILFTLLS